MAQIEAAVCSVAALAMTATETAEETEHFGGTAWDNEGDAVDVTAVSGLKVTGVGIGSIIGGAAAESKGGLRTASSTAASDRMPAYEVSTVLDDDANGRWTVISSPAFTSSDIK